MTKKKRAVAALAAYLGGDAAAAAAVLKRAREHAREGRGEYADLLKTYTYEAREERKAAKRDSEEEDDDLPAGMLTCGKCGGHDISLAQVQTRSSDEPMTVFALCEECENRWKQ
jgi:DNA-directed RNA polymerase subunit M/transcription elongation factor TFIIS